MRATAAAALYNARIMSPTRSRRVQELPDIVARLVPDAITASVILTLTAIALSLALGNPVTRVLDAYHQGLWMMLQFTMQMTLIIVLSAALLLTAVALLFRGQLINLYARHIGELDPRRRTIATVTMGAILGVLVSISSVGAGAVGVTALIVLYPHLPMRRIVAPTLPMRCR